MKKVTILALLFGLVAGCGAGGLAVAAPPDAAMLPLVYGQQEVAGWWMSEKLDGVRGYWDGRHLYSRGGHRLAPPDEFVAGFPPFPLEGELWAGRGRFEQAVSIVGREENHDGWKKLTFGIFDVPEEPGPFRSRLARIRGWLERHPSPYAFVIDQIEVRGREHLLRELQRVEKAGGEGLIVRDPEAVYRAGRSPAILKVKSFRDGEATVIAHLPGTGRNEGRMGALLVEGDDGRRFRIGSGFSDAVRERPPPLGTVVTYKYYGRYQSGLPRFPAFLRVRPDSGL